MHARRQRRAVVRVVDQLLAADVADALMTPRDAVLAVVLEPGALELGRSVYAARVTIGEHTYSYAVQCDRLPDEARMAERLVAGLERRIQRHETERPWSTAFETDE